MNECKEIYKLTEEALNDINEKYEFKKAEQLVNKIIALEDYLLQDFEAHVRFIPSRELKKILSYSPRQAVAKGILFRGLSAEDYEKIIMGQDLFAPAPDAKIPLIKHVLDPTNNPNTPYISLTSDANRARHFGNVVAIKMKRLKGALLMPKDIERLTKGDTRVKKLRKKNVEFVLAPNRISFASIPAEAVVR